MRTAAALVGHRILNRFLGEAHLHWVAMDRVGRAGEGGKSVDGTGVAQVFGGTF